MSVDPQKLFKSKWALFDKYKATKPFVFNSMGEQTRTLPAPILDTCNLTMINAGKTSVNTGSIRKFDQESTFSKEYKLIAPYLNFVVEPKINDILIDENLSELEIREVEFDPFKATVTVTVRPIKD